MYGLELLSFGFKFNTAQKLTNRCSFPLISLQYCLNLVSMVCGFFFSVSDRVSANLSTIEKHTAILKKKLQDIAYVMRPRRSVLYCTRTMENGQSLIIINIYYVECKLVCHFILNIKCDLPSQSSRFNDAESPIHDRSRIAE